MERAAPGEHTRKRNVEVKAMMDVTVYFRDGRVEKYSTPIITAEDTWDCLRVRFRQTGDKTWALVVEAAHPTDGDKLGVGEWRPTKAFLRCPQPSDKAGYLAWLADNVELVNVDGSPFWAPPED